MVALYLGLQAVVAYVLRVAWSIGRGELRGGHPDVVGAATTPIATNWDGRALVVMLVIVVVAVVVSWIVHACWRTCWPVADPPGLGCVPATRRVYFLYAVLAGGGAAILGGLLTTLLADGHPLYQAVAMLGLSTSPGIRVGLALTVVCVVPWVEELVFRGVLLSGLMRRLPTGLAVLASALVFGGVHLPDFRYAWYAVPALVGLGLVLAMLRLRARSLWPAIVAHAANNLLAVSVWFIATPAIH